MVRTKSEFLALSAAGRLGNFLRSWDTIGEVEQSGYRGFLTIRSRVPGSRHFVPVTRVWDGVRPAAGIHLACLVHDGARAEDLYIQQIPDPSARRVIQFEAMLDERGIIMHYELETTNPLRGIRDRGRLARGAAAVAILRAYLSPSSYDDLWAMWDLHPTSIIEATEFSRPVGEFGRHLLYWEVRDF